MSNDINSIIDELAQIDSASAKIMQKTQQKKNEYSEYITQQKQAFDKTLETEIENALKLHEQSEDARNTQLIKKFRTECENNMAQLNQLFKDNRNDWADTIFNNILKG